MASNNDWCPASGSLGDWRTCPGCGRKVTSRQGALGQTVPRHKLPDDVDAATAKAAVDAKWAAITRTQNHLAATRADRAKSRTGARW